MVPCALMFITYCTKDLMFWWHVSKKNREKKIKILDDMKVKSFGQ